MTIKIRYIAKTDRDIVCCFTHAAQMATQGFVIVPEIDDTQDHNHEWYNCEVCEA